MLFNKSAFADDLSVAVSSNFSSVVEKLKPLFYQQSGHQLLVSYGSSGKLYAQIINGAPFEVFLSADSVFVENLINEKKASAHSKWIYAVGQLVLCSSKMDLDIKDLEILLNPSIKHITIANSKTAPYGIAAEKVLLNKNIFNQIKTKIVVAENINQAFQFVETKNADIGFVALSQVLNKKNIKYWLVPENLYDPIFQMAVITNKGVKHSAAKEFLEFLKSKSVQKLIQDSGYKVVH